MAKITCKSCKGNKQTKGMGGMLKDCKVCGGKGETELEVITPAFVQVGQVEPLLGQVTTSSPTEPILVIDGKPNADAMAPEGTNPFFEKATDALISGVSTPLEGELAHAMEAQVVQELVAASTNEIVGALKKKEEKKVNPALDMGAMMGYTPYMVEAIMAEPGMKPENWRNKYGGIIIDPLATRWDTNKQYLPGASDRRMFRENVANALKGEIKPRKHDVMSAQNIAGQLAGID